MTATRAAGYESLARAVDDSGTCFDISFSVTGLHCAGCMRKVETALLAQPNVTHARVNFSTQKLTVAWQGAAERANHFADLVSDLGYGVRPFLPDQVMGAADSETKFLLRCLAVAGFAMGNIMLLSIALWITDTQSMGEQMRAFFHWISGLIAIPAVLYAGRPFFQSAIRALRARQTNMDVPISVALILTCGISLYETIAYGEHAYFDSVVMLMFFLLLGRYLNARARHAARGSAHKLLQGMTGIAKVMSDDGASMQDMPYAALRPDMMVRVAVGERVPVDGVITHGATQLDTSVMTGETMPRAATIGDAVFAGMINLGAPFDMRVTAQAENSLIAEIIRLMETAAQSKSRYVQIADRAARLYTPVVHLVALIAFAGWVMAGLAVDDALLIAATVLIITCPCAMALAVPVVQVVAIDRLMQAGVLVKSGDALERLAQIDTALFDKTGTLTRAVFRPVQEDIAAIPQSILRRAAGLASHSTHPLSRALLNAVPEADMTVQIAVDEAGAGLESTDGLRIGSAAWCRAAHDGWADQSPALWIRADDAVYAVRFSQDIRAGASEMARDFSSHGIAVSILSGDHPAAVAHVAAHARITDHTGHMTPTAKHDHLSGLAAQGRKALMVGDGLNDAPTLAAAHVSMAPSTGTDLAQNTADIVFMGDDLRVVADTWHAARQSLNLVRQNFAMTIVYNVLAIPLAAAGHVTPLVAALAMSGSSLLVIANAFRLRVGRGRA